MAESSINATEAQTVIEFSEYLWHFHEFVREILK